MKNCPKIRQSNLVVQDFDNEILIYDLTINKAYCLNETSALIWQLCDGKNSVADIKNQLSQKLQTPVPEEVVWLALDSLKKDNLLENEQFDIDFNGLNRRQVIRKVGLTSMIALPLIASIIAPSALMAQSGGGGTAPLGGACPGGSGCAAGLVCLSVNGPLTCCAGGTNPVTANPPGNSVGGCISNGACMTTSLSFCCSGMTTFTPNGICSNPGEGRCDCAPYA